MRNLENFNMGMRFRKISNNADNSVHMYVDVYYLTRSWLETHVPWVLGCACCCITCDVYCIVVGSWIPVSGSVSTGSNAFDCWSLFCHNYKTGTKHYTIYVNTLKFILLVGTCHGSTIIFLQLHYLFKVISKS